MSSLPASPNPQKTRVSTLGTKVRTMITARIRTARSGPREPGSEPVSVTRPTEKHPAPPAPRHRELAGVVVPDMPSAVPAPALPARIPYSEWKGPRPRAVRLAFALILLAGFISLISGVQAGRAPITELPPLVVQLGELGVDTSEYAAALQFIALAAALVVFGLYLLFAFMIREGRNWARIGGSVLVAAALVAAFLNAAVPQTVALLVAAAGLALLYRRDCARYFRPRRSQYLGES
ncbi:hypothetical protein MUG94_14820 [Arthrobacter gengyunqii]|uniref:Uncharacterized protein n=1 Tax=Arthrobacter gengyunqii TaxID=2886940 RepID=A0A9X1S4L2_9MICC|nr:hypothetical protein [Arthrobacter gengyunqii]MCC3268390.1 hypothetical protein [Arthrobacter gengyunqii]UOY95784.1 hypothetical protein MUG94_14820 [Arthrobacter gengyunqii]